MAEVPTAEVDTYLLAPSFLDDPYPVYALLREQHPVFWSEAWGVWVFTTYEDISDILLDHRSYSNAGRFTALLDQLPDDAQPAAETIRRHYSMGLIQSDPPDHTRQRRAIRDPFTPKAIEQLRPRVQQRVDDLIDVMANRTKSDLVAEFALALPLSIICDLLGVPAEDHDRFIAWSDDLGAVQATGGAKSDRAYRTSVALEELEGYFWRLSAERRRSPRDDLISHLIEVTARDEMTEYELVSMCITLVTAGHHTTKGLIANLFVTLLDQPDALGELRASPGLWPAAVEESLRFESPILRAWRRTAEEVEVHGQRIPPGDLVYLMLGAANRDPAEFPRPDLFDLHRSRNRHVAFGLGIHHCPGAALARLEGVLALRRLFERIPTIRLAGPGVRIESVHIRGFASLPVEFDDVKERTSIGTQES